MEIKKANTYKKTNKLNSALVVMFLALGAMFAEFGAYGIATALFIVAAAGILNYNRVIVLTEREYQSGRKVEE